MTLASSNLASLLILLTSTSSLDPFWVLLMPVSSPLGQQQTAENEDEPCTDGLSPDVIDMDIFGQLLEMDDEEDREFSKSIVWNYFDQAETTFGNMDDAL